MSIALRKQGKTESFPLDIGGVAAERRNGRGSQRIPARDRPPCLRRALAGMLQKIGPNPVLAGRVHHDRQRQAHQLADAQQQERRAPRQGEDREDAHAHAWPAGDLLAGRVIHHDGIGEAQLLEAFAQMKPIELVELREAFAKARPVVLNFARAEAGTAKLKQSSA